MLHDTPIGEGLRDEVGDMLRGLLDSRWLPLLLWGCAERRYCAPACMAAAAAAAAGTDGGVGKCVAFMMSGLCFRGFCIAAAVMLTV